MKARRAKKSTGRRTSRVRIDVRASVPEPKAGVDSVKLNFRIERDVDHARDAVEIDLPIKPDRDAGAPL